MVILRTLFYNLLILVYNLLILATALTFVGGPLSAQDCQSSVVIQLVNSRGGFFFNQKITLTSKVDGKIYSQNSNAQGEATFVVPCHEMFDLSISNYTKKAELESPETGVTNRTFSYSSGMVELQKLASMNPEEQKVLDNAFKILPDTIFVKSAVMPPPRANADYYALVSLAIRNIEDVPLASEAVTITGRKRNKSIAIMTDKNGRLLTYLPKGDTYDVHFKYHKSYYAIDCDYMKGSTNIKLNFSYLGTKEIEKRRKAESERILAEEKKLKETREAFEKMCKELGISVEEGHRREREKYLREMSGQSDTVITHVLNRNTWQEKLIVCDVTGSMAPYVAQLAIWYRLKYLHEKNLQFVLFNDGNDKPDQSKRTGDTGGVYYSPAKGVDSLDHFMDRVQSLGSGGDCPENNMEALIKGVKMAAPFNELVMIADNDAPVKDIRLLESFTRPVHIILCGVISGNILPDYLKIAWKTKGSIHTMEADITSLARLSEGQQITIRGNTYRIMGGEFIQITH